MEPARSRALEVQQSSRDHGTNRWMDNVTDRLGVGNGIHDVAERHEELLHTYMLTSKGSFILTFNTQSSKMAVDFFVMPSKPVSW